MAKIGMLANVTGAIAALGIFSVVTIDLATKKGNAETVKKINEEEVPRMDWYRVETKTFKVDQWDKKKQRYLDKEEWIKKCTNFINNQTTSYCPLVKIINFKKYKQLPIFYESGDVIEEPFVYLLSGEGGDLKFLKHPEWYCITKDFLWNISDPSVSYELLNHPFRT